MDIRNLDRVEAFITESQVGPGDAIAIPPGQLHQITNIGSGTLRFLCCCTPPYDHDDTILLSYPGKSR